MRNFSRLATTRLRRDALSVIEAGLGAIDTRSAIRTACRLRGSVLRIGTRSWDLAKFDHAYVIGIGKAAADAAAELESILGERISGGIVLDVKTRPFERLKSFAGSHPFPDEKNVSATSEIVSLLAGLDAKDLVIAIVSGGGSSLLCRPFAMKCDTLVLITKTLMRRGATIAETNTVRKHLSEIQGGQLVGMARAATIVGLLFSDVPGDDPGVIASGPTVLDATTVGDASEILARYGVLEACRLPNCDLRETPKDPALFARTTNILLMTNKIALRAMRTEAKKRGYKVRVLSSALSGEARDAGRMLANEPRHGEMVLAAGETTVTVHGEGSGGRNQELVLGALTVIEDDTLVISCASDGIDNTPVAGAIADAKSKRSAQAKKLDADDSLERNDSYAFFRAISQHIVTGKTGSNVSDLMIAVKAKKGDK
jgi:glycerate-2-kinase